MLSLDDPRWSDLQHAYGAAADIPALMRQLAAFPPGDDYQAEPYFSLWSALCHQGDVFSASYAAVPHIVSLLKASPARGHWSALLLVVAIEVARVQGSGPEPERYLQEPYDSAIAQLPAVVAELLGEQSSELLVRACAAAVAVSGGYAELAEAILELEPERLGAFIEWVHEQ